MDFSSQYKSCYVPTSPFTILDPQNPWIDKFVEVQERRATDFKAQEIVEGLVGVFLSST